MPIVSFSGSVFPTANVIHEVGTVTQSGVYVFKADLGTMRDGDEIELRIADKVGAGTIGCIYSVSYAHFQATQIKASPPFVIAFPGGHVSITQRAGTARWFQFEVVSI